ncbi:SRPBCC domain-containing protein [Acrocarpospora phusangensis]|uniref:SRPBCC domain-containing protein n=1 Tax=Acrocarpospora phusangensis TaxID=1070424 RepID=UPI001EF34FB5|nr:SRPBCC domain-containing protein [Acrocarpospora phusangensis]
MLSRLSGETRSKVTFTIEESAQVVKLTVIHDGFEPGSALAEMVSHGWPNVVASLKTLLETGEPLPADA